MRAVVDTSIMVRAVIKPSGSVGPVITALAASAYTLVYSDPLLTEFVKVLRRPRIRDKYRFTDDDLNVLLRLIVTRGEPVTPTRRVTLCRDPTDNMVLEAPIAGHADAIVSGDEDLLVLNPFEGIPITGPAAFLSRLEADAGPE